MEVFQFLERRKVEIEQIVSGDKNRDRSDDLTHLFKKLGYLIERKIIT